MSTNVPGTMCSLLCFGLPIVLIVWGYVQRRRRDKKALETRMAFNAFIARREDYREIENAVQAEVWKRSRKPQYGEKKYDLSIDAEVRQRVYKQLLAEQMPMERGQDNAS